MNRSVFLIDSNSLITPHLTYYPFDFAPGFWEQIEQKIVEGRIVILDLVKDEVLKGKDKLTDWISKLSIENCVDHREPNIISNYATVLQYVQANPCYKPSALHEWAEKNTADPWLIATAMTYGYMLVTLETPNTNLNSRKPSPRVKIPNVAEAFSVRTANLFEMMRELEFKLR